ncbi:MAG: tandem-95 repeat protein [bacterium]
MNPAQNETARAQEIQSQPVILGYRDFNHGTDVTGDPTEAKPESKLWHHDGFWWGVLWNDLAAEFRIHRFDPATQNWTNVGPTVDNRRRSAADVCVDGSKVYIASRAKINVHSTDSKLATLARYTYSSGSKAYSLDGGFPVDIPGTDETEALTVAKDSAGKIWAVWTRNNKIRVNSTNGSDTSWGTDFVLPVQGNDLAGDDIAALTAFDGNKIGIFWSNQLDARMYFAVHLDASDSTTWQPRETALENGANVADDHLNLAVRESDGTLIAISKTSLPGADSPYMYLNIRNPGTGVWTNTVVWRRREDPTRPMVVLNATTDSVYVFSRLKPEDGIFFKATHLDNPTFAEGNGRLLIKSFIEDVVNNPTSTKQSVTNSTGLLVLASDKDADTYMHGFLPFDNLRPIVNPDSAFTNEETPVTISVTSNDSDPDGSIDISSIAVVHAPLNGTTQVLVGEIVYTPGPGFSGQDSLFYTIKDNDGANALAAVVNIAVNDSPVALDDLASTNEDTPIDIAILANDSDTDSGIDSASVVVVDAPDNGTTALNPANGVLTYTPNANFNGTDSLTYTVADDSGGVSNQATVTIAVSDENDPPVAIDDTVTTDNATPVTIDVLANDIEVDGTVSPGSVIMTTLPSHGTANLNSTTAEIEYTPDPNFFGTDSLKYTETDDDGATSNVGTVFINVNSVPFAQNDTVVTEEETAAVIDILGNDNDPDGSLDPATVTIVTDVASGSTNINPANGNVTYTPNPGFVGTDLFTYTVKDEGGVSSNLASVQIKVNDKPTAVNDTVLTLKGVAIDIAILDNDNDTDGTLDSSSITILFGPFNGSLSINATTGVASYSPNALFSGTDIFEYEVQDNDGSVSNKATVSIRVNEPPVANPDAAITNEDTPVNIIVTPNDTDADGTVIATSVAIATPPAHGTATVNPATGVIAYAPAQDYFGPDAFTYTVDDDNGTPSNAATVTVTINDINDPPVAVNDTVTTAEDQPLEIAVLANDLDLDGTPNATSVSTPANSALGTLSVHPVTGVITYTPHQNLFGQDSFTYTFLDDDNATSNSATVFVTISPVNDAPTAVDDNATTDEDNAVAIDVLGNDSDNDGSIDETTVVVDSGPANGTTSVDPVTGLITYMPAADFFGTDTFTYTVDDNTGAPSNSATVTVTVNDVNDAPVAVNDTARALFNEPFDIDVTANDLDVDGSIVPSSILASSGTHGSTSIKPSGEITYTPNQGFLGEDSFFYSVRDDDGAGSNTATVTVFVKVPPVAVNDTVVTNEDVAIEIPVIANDSDLDGTLDPTTVAVVSPPSHGSFVVNGTTGSITYTPSANYNGPDSFQYTVSDNDGVASNVATVAITVNKAPFALNDNRTIDEDMPVDIDVSANDVDLDGSIDPTTVTLLTQPGNGSTSLNQSTGVVTYTPNPDFSGSDNFTYIVQDNNGVSTNAATVTITVTPVNDPPVAGSEVVSTNKATPIDIDITANDVDIDGTIVEASVTITAQPGNGNVSVDPTSGVVTYQPHAFFLGVDTFVYTIQDNNGAVSNFATVTINVSGDNDPPTAVNDTANTTEDLALLINVAANDIDLDGTIDATTVTILTNPVNGTASVSPVNGAITYQPVFDFFGEDSLTYQVKDNLGAISNEARVFITVFNVNDMPVAQSDSAVTDEDIPVTINIVLNDSDSDGTLDLASVAIVDDPDHGAASLNTSTGEITYTPDANFFGEDSLKYTIQDNDGGASNPATIHVTVTDVNDLPTAIGDTVQTSLDVAVNIAVTANDSDIDGTIDPATVQIDTPPGNGTTNILPNGEVTYTPNPGFGGVDGFIYSVKDDDGALSNPALVAVTIVAPPTAVKDSVATDEDVAIDIAVLGNDSDVDGSIVTSSVTVASGPGTGQATVNTTTGKITYTPASDFFGEDSFTYTVEDDDGNLSAPATVKVTVLSVNDLPVARDDTVATPEDTPVAIAVTANDSDVDGSLNVGTLTVTGGPTNGQATVNTSTGQITYTPNPNYNGPDVFTYVVQDNDGGSSNEATVNLTVTEENDLPIAADDAATTNEDVPITIDVAANDIDPDGSLNLSSVTVTSAPGHGTTAINAATGAITYTPAADFFGTDSLEYTIKDNLGVSSNAATVTLTVNPINDAPRTADDVAATSEDTPVMIAVTANDVDVDGTLNFSTLTITSAPGNGTVQVNPANGEVTYTPNLNFSGQDSFNYTIKDNTGLPSNESTVTISVSDENDLPLAQDDQATTDEDVTVVIDVAANDSDPDGSVDPTSVTLVTPPTRGTATVDATTGQITYTPAADFNGSDSLKYTIKDNLGASSNEATVTITVNPVNDLPVALNDTVATPEDTQIVIPVTANDSDVEGPLNFNTLTVTGAPANGLTVVNSTTGEIDYTPNPDFNGQDFFTYTVQDGEGATSNEATVVVNVTEANDAPVAQSDTTTTDEETPVVIDVAANDSDADGSLDLSTVTVTSGPGQGSIVVNPTTGEMTYTPAENFSGEDSLKYTVDDNLGLSSNVATVLFMVNPVNDAPVAENDTTATSEDTPVTIAVTQNDSDVDGSLDSNTLTVTSGPANGVTTVSTSTGEITYTPAANFNGQDSFTYTIQDDVGATSNEATVVITVSNENDPPVAQNDSVSTDEEVPLVIDVAANDSDDTGLNLTSVSIDTPPTHGTASVNPATGEIIYTPAENFFGQDSLRYTIEDDSNLTSNVASVTMTVNPVNDLPVAIDDTRSTLQGVPVDINAIGNDSDVDGTLQPGSVAISVAALNGTTSINPVTGVITYTPNAAFVGTDQFSYTVNDNDGGTSNIATVSITVTEPQTLSFQSVHDGQVKVTAPGNNYGFKGTTKVETGKFISYFKFVVSGVTGQVQSAKVVLQVTNGVSDGGDSGGSIFLVSNDFLATNTPWIEQTLTSGNAPEITGSALSTLGAVATNQVVEFDVTSAVNGDGTFSFAVRPNSGNRVKYYTKEGTVPPQLVIATGGGGQNSAPVAVNDNATATAGLPLGIDVTANDSDSDGTVDVTTVTVVSQPANGATSVNAAIGVVTYTPNAGFGGTDTFTYTVRDDDGATSNAATVTIEVLGGNTAPVAVNDNASTTAGISVSVDVTANDTDSDGTVDVTTVAIVTLPANGTATVNNTTGVVTYTPASGFAGTETFTYTVNDDAGATSNAATVTVTVQSSGGSQSFTFESMHDGQVKLTDPGANYGVKATMKVDGGKFTSYMKFNVTGVSAPIQSARVRLRVTDAATDGGDNGGSIFLVDNNFAGTGIPWVEQTLTSGNAPAATGSPLSTLGPISANQTVELDVTGAVTGNGIVSFAVVPNSTNGVKYYTKEGIARPELIVTTGSGGSSNNPPVAVNDNGATVSGTPVAVDVTVNDTDSDGTIVVTTVAIVSQPLNGSASVNGSTGVVTYSPNAGFSGTDTFTYTVKDDDGATSNAATVTVQVQGSNVAPVATDDNANTTAGNSVAIDVTANDSDSDGTIDVSTVTIGTPPTNGSTTVSGLTGVVTYTPDAGFDGTDTFTYTVKDDDGANSNGATVTVSVAGGGTGGTFTFEPTEDGQVKLTDPGANYGTKATMKVDGGKFSSYLKFVVTGISSAVQSARVRLRVTDALSDGGDNGGSIFQVDNNFSGVGIPWVEQTLTSGNAPAAAGSPLSTLGAVAPSQTVEFEVTNVVNGNGTFSFAIVPNSTNKVKFYTKEGSTSPQLVITTGSGGSGNNPPVAANDNAATTAGNPVPIDVTANDSDSDGTVDFTSVTITSQPANGTTSVNATFGFVTYTPNAGFGGTDTFTYTVRDDDGAQSNAATVTVQVIGGNQAPVANADNGTTTAGNSVALDVTANDTDSDGTINFTTVSIVTPPGNGTATVNSGTGVVTYTPNGGFDGTDTFTYTVNDDDGAPSNAATVTVTVQPDGGGTGGTFTFEPTDDGQVKLTDAGLNYGSKATMKVDGGKFSSYLKFVVSGVTGAIQSARVRLRVTDAATDGGDNGGSLFLVDNNFSGSGNPWVEETLTSGNAPAATGSALSTLGAISPSQTVEFDVSAAVHGNGIFSFALVPNSGNAVKYFTKEGTVRPELIVVTGSGGGNTAPVAANDNSATTAGTPVAIDVTANDSDSDGTIDVTTVAIVTPPGNGTVTVNGTGVVTYTSSVGFSGSDTFTYTVKDDDGATSNAATVSVVVTGGNQPPVAVNDNANAIAGTPILIDVTVNDTDSDGTINVTTVTIVTPPGNGSAVVSSSTGVVTYTPNAGFSGTDSFSYSVKDNDGATSNAATVTVSVAGGSQTLTFAPSHDGQVKLSDPGANYGTKGTMKVERGKFSTYLKFVVSGVTGTVQSAILRLRVTVDPGDGSDQGGSIFRASNNFTGTATPWQEGTLTSGNAPDVISGALSTLGPVAENTLVDLDVSGAVAGNGTFSFCITSNSGNQVKYYTKEGTTAPQLIVQTGAGAIIVKGENVAPSAVDDAMTTKPGVAVEIDVLANDLDVDGKLRTSTVAPVTSPSNGKVRVEAATGVLVYTPHPGFTGRDSFNYIVYDEQGMASNPAQVVVTVNMSGNVTPRATDDDATTYSSVAVSIPVTQNDSDSDGAIDAASIAILAPAGHGTVRLDGERGLVIYHPDKGFVGADEFTYQIRDDSGALSNTATVKIAVQKSEAQVLAFLPTDDAFVRASSPTDNFGAVSELRATNGTAEFYSFLKFSVSGLTGAVQRATLKLFIAEDNEGGEVYAVSNRYRNSETAWQEDGLVWDNAPEISGAPLAPFEGEGKGRYVEIDVTTAVRGENVFSFGLNSHGSETAVYESKEGPHPPQLVVETGEAEGSSPEVTDAATGTPKHLPDAISLSPNYPNPFNPETNILYALPQDAKVKLEIYNVRGQLVRTLVNEVQTAGFKRIRWQGNDSSGILVGSGVYFMRLEVGSQKFSRRIILQK